MNDGTKRILYDVQVRSDSVIGIHSDVVTPAAFARKDVTEMQWPNWGVDRSVIIKMRDGKLHALQGASLTMDSVVGFSPGPRTRIAIARPDVQKVEQRYGRTGTTLGFIAGFLAIASAVFIVGVVRALSAPI
jgi:hypothetical protein